MEIGDLQTTKLQDGGYDANGRIRHPDIGLSFSMKARSMEAITDNNSPTHDLFRKDREGQEWKVGVVWQRRLHQGEFEGEAYFSMSFDDPALPPWLGNIAAFPADRAGNYKIVSSRKGRRAA